MVKRMTVDYGIQAANVKKQDALELSAGEWKKALKDPQIFSSEALRMVFYVYNEKRHRSTASAIATAFSTRSRKLRYHHICAWNRQVAKALYQKYEVEPPVDEIGGRKYWNVVFDADPQQPLDQHKHFYWRLRPNLVAALHEMV